jgi:hypothetical protein
MSKLWVAYVCAGICVLCVYTLEKDIGRRTDYLEEHLMAVENILYNMQE